MAYSYSSIKPHPTPQRGVYEQGWSFRREERATRSLTSGSVLAEESTMSTATVSQAIPAIKFEYLNLNWVASDPLARDQEPSHLLHQPGHRINTIDPMTGKDIDDLVHHPYQVDGDLTIYFETEASRRAFRDMPLDEPNLHLPYPATDDDDRGG